MKRTKVQRRGSAPTENDRHSSWLTKTAKRAAQTLLLGAAIFGTAWCGNAQAQVVDQPANPPLWNGTWIDPTNQAPYTYNDAIISVGADRLHAIGITGQGLTTAVINGGFDSDHEIFTDKIVNGFTWQTGGFSTHGTHVAGIVLSMAPDSNVWLDTYKPIAGGFDDALTGAMFDQLGADAALFNIVAVNNSWGDPLEGTYPDSDSIAAAYPLTDAAVQNLLAQNVAIVAASGNAAVNDRMSYPEGLSGVLAVGALNASGYITSFSTQYEKEGLFLVAPGARINSATLEGGGISNYGTSSGTSMASPHVTGAITLLSSGARMASTEEIVASLVDSADRIPYDGSAVVSNVYMNGDNPNTLKANILALGGAADVSRYTDWLDGVIARYAVDEVTADEWRIMNHIGDAIRFSGNDKDGFVLNMVKTGDLNPLQFTEYGFLRADKAFMNLTHKRTDLIADRIDRADPGLAGIMYAYADELGADINGHAAQVFQRLDALSPAAQFVVARQMSPRFGNAVTESAHYGTVGIHRAFGRRTELNRLGQGANSRTACDQVGSCEPCEPCEPVSACDPCSPCGKSGVEVTGWVEGFGTGFDRSYTLGSGSYDGSFAGTSFGLERKRKNVSVGVFGNWSNHQVKGDGKADGDWGTFGAYGRIDRRRGFVEGSIAGSFGDYDMTRNILIPGVVFTGNQPGTFVFDWAPNMFEQAKSKFDTQSVSFRLAAGRDLWKTNGWVIGPRAEMSMSYLDMDGYTEKGAQSLNLHVNRYKSTYLEGGFGVFAGKFFAVNGQRFVASGKVMGMGGGTMGGDMYGNFVNNGSAFRVKPGHTTTGWIVPEATLAWNLTDGIVLSGSYAGRFGEKYSENSGSVALSFYW